MKKCIYNFDELLSELKKYDNIVFSLGGYDYDNNNITVNLQYYNGVFCYNKTFNLCSNFTKYKITKSNLKSIFKKCGCLCVQDIDFSDENKKEAFNYNNFIKSFK